MVIIIRLLLGKEIRMINTWLIKREETHILRWILLCNKIKMAKSRWINSILQMSLFQRKSLWNNHPKQKAAHLIKVLLSRLLSSIASMTSTSDSLIWSMKLGISLKSSPLIKKTIKDLKKRLQKMQRLLF